MTNTNVRHLKKQIIENNWTPGELSQKSKEIH